MANLSLSPVLTEKLNQLSILFEISQILDRSLDLREVIKPVMRFVADRLGLRRGTITLLNRQTGEIFIEESYGLSTSEQEKGRYRLGEGVTGKVIQSGEPLIVPRISQEPLFLNRTGARSVKQDEDLSFVCVPIKQGNQTVGAMGWDRSVSDRETLEIDFQVLSIVCSMIAQAVRLRQEYLEERQSLLDENQRLRSAIQERFRPANFVGKSHAMQAVFDLVSQVAHSDATVLIRGESGTGKEMVAQTIHFNSPRAEGPFIKVNCAALPETIIESELFGHERGAFTGAVATRKGRFEMADGGTIFLDEIGDLSPLIQVKLLRVLQEKELERVGGGKTLKVDVRIVAATNRNLEEAMEKNEFREDLYYRLNVFPVHLPPLRERKSDIPLLVDHFIEKYNQKNNKGIKRISTSAINILMSYHWPGNVRELENCMERAILLSNEDVIMAHHLPPTLQTAESSGTVVTSSLQETLDAMEREIILDALKSSKGNYSKAARALGISERIMGLRVRKHGIEKDYFSTIM